MVTVGLQLKRRKRCNKCNRSLGLKKFSLYCRSKDGYQPTCKECVYKYYTGPWQVKYAHKHALQSKIWRMRHPRKAKAVVKKYQYSDVKRLKDVRSRAAKKDFKKHLHRHYARRKAGWHTAKGNIVKQPCTICGNRKVYKHHCDYNKPLDIMWLCRKHHDAWHRVFIAEG